MAARSDVAQHEKRRSVLRWLVEDFEPGRRYPEAEVNQIIGRRHGDFATLRRYLVARAKGIAATSARELAQTLGDGCSPRKMAALRLANSSKLVG
jgi:hypothetical protein